MKYGKRDLLERANLSFIGETLITSSCEYNPDGMEDNPDSIEESMIQDIKTELVAADLSKETIADIMGYVETYVSSRETLYFIYGMRAGGKLFKELAFGEC